MTDDVELVGGDWIVRVAPQHGGRIAQIVFHGSRVLCDDDGRQPNRALLWGCYPMVPWAGRLRHGTFVLDGTTHVMPINEPPHALHGLTLDTEWNMVEVSSTSVTMLTRLSGIAPFDAECEHRVNIDDGGVTSTLTLRSLGPVFPGMVGWHPWFSRAFSHDASFEAMLRRDSDNIVTTSRVEPAPTLFNSPLDDCFVGARQPPRISNGNDTIDLSSDCNHWMVYTGAAHAFCIEPMSGPPNCLDESHPDRILVTPERPLRRHLRFHGVLAS